jgi:hypothetical protein
MSCTAFDKVLATMSEQLLVSHIFVPNPDACTWNSDPASILSKMNAANYDLMPLIENKAFIGYVERKILEQTNEIRTAYKEITVEKIVSADTAITDMINLFQNSRFFFVLEGNDLVGLVTYSDLNKSPVRALIFILISKFEFLLLQQIKNNYENSLSWFNKLDRKRQNKISNIFENKKKADADTVIEDCLNLGDMICILEQDEDFRSRIGYLSKSSCEKELGCLDDLRNRTMHPSDSLIDSYDDVAKLGERVERLKKATLRIQSLN